MCGSELFVFIAPRVYSRDPGLNKIQCGIREVLTEYGIWLLPGKRDSLKSGHGCRIGNTLGARDFPCTVSGRTQVFMVTRAKEFFQTTPEGTQASRASPLLTSAFGRHRSIQGGLWLTVKETNIQTTMTEVPQGGGGVFPGIFGQGVTPGSPFLIPILLCLSDPSRIETINTFIPAFVVSSKTTPDSRPIWAKSIPFSDRNGTKTIPFGAAHTYMAYIRECPTPFGRSSGCGIIVKKVRECGSGTPFLGRPKSEASKRGWRTLPYPG